MRSRTKSTIFTDCVVPSSVIVGGIFFTGDHLFRVKQLPVCTSTDLINYSGFQVNEHSSWHVFASTRFSEKRVEGVIFDVQRLIRRHLTIWSDPMLQAVQFPAGIAHLDTGLTDMDGKTFTHFDVLVD